uniref:aspartyl aminopeptidase n=1 Tax=Bionectria ochroleuca TaxID=29856 RepID=A0A0B7JL13_BIOOC
MFNPVILSPRSIAYTAHRASLTASRLLHHRFRPFLDSPTPLVHRASFSAATITMAPNPTALDFVDFVNASPTPYHAVYSASQRFEKVGFQLIKERDSWASTLRPGGKYYLTRNGSSIVAFTIGRKWRPGNPVAIVGAHTDSPCLRVKPVSKKAANGFLQIGVETYGGGIWHSWFDRDLSLAGRVLVRDGDNFVQKLVKIDKPLIRIPTLAIHLHRQSNFDPNKETELGESKADEAEADPEFQPLKQMSERHHPRVLDVVASELGIDAAAIADFELVLYDTQKSVIGGINDEFVFSPRLDNLGMTYCSVEGLIASLKDDSSLDNDSTIRLTVCFDHEEIGSQSAQGAHSNLLPSSYDHVNHDGDEATAFEQTLSRSFLVSADMAHSVHPNYAGKYESSHQPTINGGTVIKINANQRYATNSPGIVLLQDIRETGGTEDVGYAIKLFSDFFENYGTLEPRILVD